MISLKNVYKKYGDVEILKDFSLSFEENKITCLFGPSGVGKTTIANIAACLTDIDGGMVTGIKNTVYSYVFQDHRLLPWYSVYDNIDFVLKDIYPDEKRKDIIHSYIDIVGLKGYEKQKPSELSGGMCQRVSLARAFAYPSDFLILDEPFKGLDLKIKNDIIHIFKNLWNENKRTVLFITHDINETVDLSDYIYVLSDRPVKIIKKIILDEKSNHKNIFYLLENLARL
ncbi:MULTISPECIES: ABC transporter ATP-binding protein [unclassified Sedimentibacter]|uniref:ABC transporter ATP-binding protein n=1 Tax=unclassified Sedimentibacter TaxID=2649220 RepID=UPI0027E212CB|nr:ABC transporter ATP-binding protein [Sedimentibacter sp. MB35-C1]WMJ78384.1 ABC transporter ATP-binding protein [Sedimentibacter sp. MB35-C1]